MSTLTMYSYASAKSNKFSLAAVRIVIDRLLADSSNDLYPQVERLLSEPGTTGRVSWDQCMAVQLILDVDGSVDPGENGEKPMGTGELTAMVAKGQLTMPMIGTELYKVLRSANFVIERGRISGVSEAVPA